MSKEIDITNPNEVAEMILEIEKRIRRANKYHATAVADYILQKSTEEIQEGRFETAKGTPITGVFNTGELMRSSGRKITKNKIIVGFGAAHSIDMEYGLTPNETRSKTTYQDILRWVKDKGIGKNGGEQIGMARKILKNLYQFGVSPRPFFRRGISKAQADTRKILNAITPKMNNILKYGKVIEPKK